MNNTEHSNQDWWRGVGDLTTIGLVEGAERLENVHLSIADETFNILASIPVTRPVSERVRGIHHGIARFCYRSVATGGRAANRAFRSPTGE